MKDSKRKISRAFAAGTLAVAMAGGCGEVPEGADETGGPGSLTDPAETPAPPGPEGPDDEGVEGIEQIPSALRAPGCVRVVGHSYDFWNETNKYFVQNSCDRWWYVSVDLGGLWSNTGCNFVLPGQITMFTKWAPWKVRYNGVDRCGQ